MGGTFSGQGLGSAYITIGGDLSNLTRDFARAKGMTSSATATMSKQAQVKMGLNIAGFKAGLSRAKQQLSTNLKSLNTQIRTSQEKLQQNYGALFDMSRRVGMGMVAAGGAITGAFALAVRTTANFQQSMANVQSVAGATGAELQKLTNYARIMGKQSVFSASQAADAMYYLASAGYDTEKIMGSLEGTLKLAAATQSDLAFTTETVVSTLAAFGMEASESNRVSNVFAATISASQAKMDKLSTSMSYVAPVARSVGLSLEQTTAILGQLYNAGIDASMAGTALRMGIAQLLDPTAETTSALERLGIALYDDAGKIRPFLDLIRDLEAANIEAADALAIFGIRAGPGMLALIKQGSDSLDELVRKVTDTDKAAEMAATQINTFKGAMKLFRSAVEELQISIGTTLLPMLTSGIKHFTSMTNAVSALTTKFPALTGAIAKLGAVLGPMVLAGGVLAIATPTLVTMAKGVMLLKTAILVSAVPAIAKFGAALLAFAANPYVAATVALAGLATALTLYYKRANDAKKITEELEKAVENLPALSQISIDVLIEEAEKKLTRFQRQTWQARETLEGFKNLYEGTTIKKGFWETGRFEVGSAIRKTEDQIESLIGKYDDVDQALRKLLETQGRYTYAATSVSAEVLENTQKEFRAILLKIQGLKDEERQLKKNIKEKKEWANPYWIERWNKELANTTDELSAAKAEYDDLDKRLMGMYRSMADAGKATEDTSKAVKEAITPTSDLEAAHTALAAALAAVESKQTLLNKSLSVYQSQLGKISEVAGETVDKGIQEYLRTPKFPRTLQEVTQQALRDLRVTGIEAEAVTMGKIDTSELESRISETIIFLREAMGTGYDELSDREKEYWQFRVMLAENKTAILKDIQQEYIRWQAEKHKGLINSLSSNLQTFVDTFEWPKEPLMEWGRTASNVARSTEYAFTDLFASMIDPSVKPAWAQFWDSLKNIAINSLAEIAVESTFAKIKEAITGIGGLGGLFAAGGPLGLIGLSVAGAAGIYKLFEALYKKEDAANRNRQEMISHLYNIDESTRKTQQWNEALPAILKGTGVVAIPLEPPPAGRLPPIGGPPTIGGQTIPPWGGQLQYGGIVTRPTVAMVGEAGPEAIIPLRRGTMPVHPQTQVIQPNVIMSPGAIQITESYPNVRLDTQTMDQRMRMYEKTLRPVVEEWVSRGMFLNARR